MSGGITKLNISRNKTQDIFPQCKVVIYDWSVKTLTIDEGVNSQLAKSTALDVSSQLLTANISKTMGGPSGTFSFTLSNSPGIGSKDWKDLIKRGFWCVIYMSRDGSLSLTSTPKSPDSKARKLEEAKKIRCIGYIDRVAPKISLNDRGAFDIVYEVSGRDFGVIYEDTTIWHNVFKYERIVLDAIATSQLNITGAVTIDKAMRIIHDLFFNPKAVAGTKVNSKDSLTEIALQWLLPRQLLVDIGFSPDIDPFWGELAKITTKFETTSANVAIEKPTDYLSGNAWDTLKRLSVPEFHELFTETTDTGIPTLTFRPIPFAIDKSNYPTIGTNVKLYKDLPNFVIPAVDLIGSQVGEDDHARYNSFLVTVSTSLINTEDNIFLLSGSGFPLHIQDSIKRHGFRPMHVTVDSIVKNAEKSDGRSNAKILREFNWLMYDYWNNAVFAESGEIEIEGRNETKIGKTLSFDENTPYLYGKRYYIEGYNDSYVVGEKGASTWTQSIMVTRGFEEADLKSKSNFGSRSNEFTRFGEFTPKGSDK